MMLDWTPEFGGLKFCGFGCGCIVFAELMYECLVWGGFCGGSSGCFPVDLVLWWRGCWWGLCFVGVRFLLWFEL